jgi:mRNA interferase RelE/StbE
MAGSLRYASAVSRDLQRLDPSDARFVLDSLERFASRCEPAYESRLVKSGRVKRLKGEWKGYSRLKLRAFRVIYKRHEESLVVFVVRASHRTDAYRS